MRHSLADILARWAPPVLVPLGVVLAWLAGPAAYNFWVSAPTSVFEHMLGVVLLAAILTGAYAATRPETRNHQGLRAWLIAWCIALFYFLGEDLNWGQYVFNWTPPEFFLEHNKEAETNLHNMSTWFNQKPRMVVQLWVLAAGVLVPLGWNWLRRVTARFVPDILWPGRATVLLALVTTLIPVTEWIAQAFLGPDLGGIPIRTSEIQEFFFAWFMLLYAIDLTGRIRSASQPRDGYLLRAPAE